MTEKMSRSLISLIPSNNCNLEGFQGRPKDCPNHPWKHPENHKPEICIQCIKGQYSLKTEEDKWIPLENTEDKDSCPFEGINGRPTECNNNPSRNSNWSNEVCGQCITNPEVAKIANQPLPLVYIEYKVMNHRRTLNRPSWK